MMMPDFSSELRELLASFGAAAAGRALLLADVVRQNITLMGVVRTLLWELPLCAGFAVVGLGICEVAELRGWTAAAVVGVVANRGPAFASALIEALIPALRRKGG